MKDRDRVSLTKKSSIRIRKRVEIVGDRSPYILFGIECFEYLSQIFGHIGAVDLGVGFYRAGKNAFREYVRILREKTEEDASEEDIESMDRFGCSYIVVLIISDSIVEFCHLVGGIPIYGTLFMFFVSFYTNPRKKEVGVFGEFFNICIECSFCLCIGCQKCSVVRYDDKSRFMAEYRIVSHEGMDFRMHILLSSHGCKIEFPSQENMTMNFCKITLPFLQKSYR